MCVCVVKFLVKFDLEVDLTFKISDGENLVKFWGRTFVPARKARKNSGRISGQISDQISGKVSETSFQISRLFSETSFSRRAVLRVSEMGSAKNGVRKLPINVRIDDAGSILNFRISFSLGFSAVASQLRPSCPIGSGGIGGRY